MMKNPVGKGVNTESAHLLRFQREKKQQLGMLTQSLHHNYCTDNQIDQLNNQIRQMEISN